MKTIHQIKKELAKLYEIDPKQPDQKEVRAGRKQVVFLTCCLAYLETDPRPEFIMKQIKDLDIKIQKEANDFPLINFPKSAELTALKKKYYKESGIDKMQSQMKVLKYILNG